MRFADKIKGTDGQNPFADSQARNFSDSKVFREFFPISLFWTLFNDQHEVLLGTRGSGKTFLLKMMRYSMLKNINDGKAKLLVREKKYIALYVPMHLEFVLPFNNSNLTEEKMISLFQVAFNCFLSESLLEEVKSILEDYDNEIDRVKTQIRIVEKIEEIWFGEKTEVVEFDELKRKIRTIYYGIDWDNPNLDSIPPVFKRQICSPLVSVQDIVISNLNLTERPTWIVCVDEAEFLNETMQKCINGIFRSDSNRIALKIATLPYHHSTLETLQKDIVVSEGNDFNYTIVDMSFDDDDFKGLTNYLCKQRLIERFSSSDICETLETFVGTVGKDDYIDYYRQEIGPEKTSQDEIEKSIINSFGERRKKRANEYANKRKTIYDKFAPVYYVREMKKLSSCGNRRPGWYAGAKMIRRVSQGNPRLFIQIMSDLFEKAKNTQLNPKVQHEVIYSFAGKICNRTKALEKNGPKAYKKMELISQQLSDRIHGGYLVAGGNSFTIKLKNEDELDREKDWLTLAIAYSRIIVDDEAIKNGLAAATKYAISNAYSIKYWIPMRSNDALSILVDDCTNNEYEVNYNSKKTNHQVTIYEVEDEENN